MKKQLFLLLFWVLSIASVQAQASATLSIPKNRYGLPVVNTKALYQDLVAQDPKQELVELQSYIPGLVLDIKYATADNLVKEPVYNIATAYARKPVADALKKIQEELKPLGLGLKIYDGYRPYHVTELFFKKVKRKAYVANPKNGSRHNRGCAIDLTLINLKDGKELEMPTPYDATVVQSHPDYPHVSEQVKKNRALLINTMQRHGFTVFHNEWWHFDFNDWPKYPLMDIRFKDLKTMKQ
ncbi:M15 family metallopeptidase [Rufibacter latericius]|uniref:D-alanyl-D-alanine dipeptidase n=1 Tax=Rufibacter latericius TaxID=2487040 RepID=A0A3M9MNA5_9BACT|nr:M15 family metallopeptidase [Rufibacter latericius]RNI27012.1 D-alanyl-D-alanine dipeptidase [Rufibacter latericius]